MAGSVVVECSASRPRVSSGSGVAEGGDVGNGRLWAGSLAGVGFDTSPRSACSQSDNNGESNVHTLKCCLNLPNLSCFCSFLSSAFGASIIAAVVGKAVYTSRLKQFDFYIQYKRIILYDTNELFYKLLEGGSDIIYTSHLKRNDDQPPIPRVLRKDSTPIATETLVLHQTMRLSRLPQHLRGQILLCETRT